MTENQACKGPSKSKKDGSETEEGNFSECMLARVIAKLAIKAQCEDAHCDHEQCQHDNTSSKAKSKSPKPRRKPTAS